MYKFRRSTEQEIQEKRKTTSCKIWGLGGIGGDEHFALFYGRVRTLFGEPDYTDSDYECMYSYEITAEDENGNKLFLEVYHGPSGAAIGGMPRSEIHEQAAAELAEYIDQAEPSDYVWEGIYADIPMRIKYTVKDGSAEIDNEFLDFDEDYDEIFG